MKLESVVTRMGIPMERPFHDALSDTLYTADICRRLDLRAGLTAYPTEDETLHQNLCPTPGDYRDFKVFRGYLEQSTWKLDPVIGTMACPVCGTALQPDDVWLKRGAAAGIPCPSARLCGQGRRGRPGRVPEIPDVPPGRPALGLCPLHPDAGRCLSGQLEKAARPVSGTPAHQGRKAGRRSSPEYLRIENRAGKRGPVPLL